MKCKTYQYKTCDGHIYIVVNRIDNGGFHSIQVHPPSKTNMCGGAYAWGLQDLLTFALRRTKMDNEHDLRLIHKALSHHHCNAMPTNKDGAKSCSDCLAKVIKKEFLDKLLDKS